MAEHESILIFVMPLLTVLLARLRAPEFALKDEQKEAILAVYEENGRLCEPTNWFCEEHFLSDPPLCI